MNWTLEQLRTFAVVAERGTMTAAAEVLGFTVGAVSQQMASLQRGVTRPIFAKHGRGVALSDTGETLLRHARIILDAEEKAAVALSRPQSELATEVNVGVFGSAAAWAIKPAIDSLRSSAPNLTVRTVEVEVESMSQAVMDRQIDLALGLSYSDEPLALPRDLVASRLHKEQFLMVLPSEAGRLVGPELMEFANDTGWILPPVTSSFGRVARLACRRAGVEPKVEHTVTDTAVSIALAEAGLGIALATPLMMGLRPTSNRTCILPGGSSRSIVGIARLSSMERESIRAVRDALSEAFSPPA